MRSSKHNLTIRHLFCCVFVFASFFPICSNGFNWSRPLDSKTVAEIGKEVTIRWQFSLSRNETHYQSRLTLGVGNDFPKDIADRQGNADAFLKDKNNLLKKVDYEVHGQQNISLVLKNVQKIYDGSFCLHVKYKFDGSKQPEKTRCTELYSFAYPLVVLSPNKSIVVNETELVSLYCKATGKPEPDITWKKADDPSTVLASSNWFNLTVTAPTVQGLYMCIANNSFGNYNKTFFVEVQYKPEIQYISDDQTLPEGSTVLLQCNASGNPVPNVAWAKNDNMGDVLISGKGNATLEITNINRTHTGDYYCTATNKLGETSNRTRLTVHHRPTGTKLTAHAEPGPEIIVGRALILNCTISSALPEVNQFRFYRNGSSVGNANYGVLKIANITSSESGEYKCVPSNSLGEGDPANIVIDVLVPPILFDSMNGTITINEFDTLELRCRAKGNPSPNITWTKGSSPLPQDNVYKKENASRDDAGVYRCTANNNVGNSVYLETTVIVNYAPEITYITTEQTVNETNSVSLRCNASGLPNPLVQWFKGFASLGDVSTDFASETLTSVTRNDTGEYTCKAINFLGTKFDTTKLTVQYKPIDTDLSTVTGKYEVQVNNTLTLNCSAQASPKAHLFTFSSKNQTRQSSQNRTYIIKKQKWSPAEEYTCIPENILGEGPSSSINISFLEQPSFREPPKKGLTVNESEAIELKCIVNGKPKPSVTWTRDGASETIGFDEVFIKNNTNRSDSGTYRCRASNGVGQAIEAAFPVVVNYKPIDTRLTSTNGREGVAINEYLALKCSVKSVPPPHAFSFKINGTVNQTSPNETFIVHKNRPFYDENHTCVATNKLGQGKESNIITITMFEFPKIYPAAKNVTVDENETMTLECIASGKPQPNVTWTKGNSAKVLGTSETYRKDRTEKCDAGVYWCTADNDVGKPASSQVTVTVKSYPKPPTILHIAVSIPRIEVHWEQPTTDCSLPITGYLAQVRNKESQGEWTDCDAKNETKYWSCSFGELESSTTYTLQIFAENRFGKGTPAERDFTTKEKGSLSGSSDASKGGLSKNSYIIIGGCIGGLLVLIVIVVVVKKLRIQHGESNLQTPIELREPEEGQQNPVVRTELQNGHDGPMSASQETLDVIETEEIEVKDIVEDNKL